MEKKERKKEMKSWSFYLSFGGWNVINFTCRTRGVPGFVHYHFDVGFEEDDKITIQCM